MGLNLKEMVVAHPTYTLGVVAILVVILLLVVVYYHGKYTAKVSSASMPSYGTSANMHKYQDSDMVTLQGNTHLDATRAVIYRPGAQNKCPPGWAVSANGKCIAPTIGADTRYAVQEDDDAWAGGAGSGECGAWNPEAAAEAQALATTGSLQHDSYGERALQHTINAAFDGGLSDEHLVNAMHNGGS